MPRPATVSSEQLTDALMRLVVDGGLEAVSVRTVAKEAGVSVGAVQYHFKTKDDLLYAAYERVIDQVALRAQAIAGDERARLRPPAAAGAAAARRAPRRAS